MARRKRSTGSIIGLTPDSIAAVIKKLRSETFPEPMPLFSECNLGKLVSTLKTPFLRPQNQKKLTEQFCSIAAHLFCLIIENHCFPNGNKRTAVSSLVTIGYINGFKFRTNLSNVKLYALSMAVSLLSKYKLFNEAVEEIRITLMDSIIETKKPRQYANLKREFLEFMNF